MTIIQTININNCDNWYVKIRKIMTFEFVPLLLREQMRGIQRSMAFHLSNHIDFVMHKLRKA